MKTCRITRQLWKISSVRILSLTRSGWDRVDYPFRGFKKSWRLKNFFQWISKFYYSFIITFHFMVHEMKNATKRLIRPTDKATFWATGDWTKKRRAPSTFGHSAKKKINHKFQILESKKSKKKIKIKVWSDLM